MKRIKLIAIIFSIVGIGLVAGAIASYIHTKNFIAAATKVNGTVVELVAKHSNDGTTYAPHVVFTTTDGKEIQFVSNSSSNPPGFAEGEQVEILYLPSDPQNATINSTGQLWGITIFLSLFNIPFLGFGLGVFLYSRFKNKKNEDLIINGNKIIADFQGIELNQSFSYNGQNPYQIIAQWLNEETNEVHIFKSENIWFDPTNYIERKLIAVYLDPKKPKRYYVDISFLPKLAN